MRYFTDEHEWIEVDGDVATVGITDYAQGQLGDIVFVDLPEPDAPGPGEVTLRVKAVALNHIDVWGWRGMAFAKRKMPLTIGAEASGIVEAIGPVAEVWDRLDSRGVYGSPLLDRLRAG